MALATYTVKRGDSLWKIASNYGSSIAGSNINAKIDTLVRLNNIPNRNLIYTGQVLKLSDSAGGSSTSSSSTAAAQKNTVDITALGLQSESSTGRDIFACWTWHKLGDHTKNFKVRWEWDYPNPAYPNGYETKYQEVETTDTWAAFTIPEEFRKTANWAQVFITPIAEQQKNSKGEEIGPYWTAGIVGKWYSFSENPPLPPPVPEVEIDQDTLQLTASISNIKADELDAVSVKFNIVRDNETSIHISQPVSINTTSNYVSYQYTVEEGHTYTVRACSVSAKGKESGWSDFSGSEGTKPSAPAEITVYKKVKYSDGRSVAVHLEWTEVKNAESYKVEYTTLLEDFTNNSSVDDFEESTGASKDIVIQESDLGSDYYFRVRAKNKYSSEYSDPSPYIQIPVGNIPEAPSTYSTSDSVFVGETMELHWVHNPSDTSEQTKVKLTMVVDDINGIGTWPYYHEYDVLKLDENDEEIHRTTVTKPNINNVSEIYDLFDWVQYKDTVYVELHTNHPNLIDRAIRWTIKTAGVTEELGKESKPNTIYIYSKPQFNLSMTKDIDGTGEIITTLDSFPFYVHAKDTLLKYDVQRPIGYYLQVISKDYYSTVDDIGRTKIVNPGDSVYSKYFTNITNELLVTMTPDNLDLESSIRYILRCTEDLSTGLTISAEYEFDVNWVDNVYSIDADISIDCEAYTALVTPYCVEKISAGPGGKNLVNPDSIIPLYQENITVNGNDIIIDVGPNIYGVCLENVNLTIGKTYTFSSGFVSEHDNNWGYRIAYDDGTYSNSSGDNSTLTITITKPVKAVNFYVGYSFTPANPITISDLQIERGFFATAYEEYYESYVDGDLIDNIELSVYRREYDGSYKEIATGIPNHRTSVTDPHPSLDYARYRFIAKDMKTGAISFYDMTGCPVNCSSVILQWEEEWRTFDLGEETAIESPPWSGSLLKLPYNIKITDKRKRDATLVKYAGREYPVAYYGTQIGETSQWSMEIPADDKETVYALRRLSLWAGNVYVREPSGMGFWASIEVSFNKSYDDVKIPITLDVTRVEGGV